MNVYLYTAHITVSQGGLQFYLSEIGRQFVMMFMMGKGTCTGLCIENKPLFHDLSPYDHVRLQQGEPLRSKIHSTASCLKTLSI